MERAEATAARPVIERCAQLELARGDTRSIDDDVTLLVVLRGLVVIRSVAIGGRPLVTSDAADGVMLPGLLAKERLSALRPSVVMAVPSAARAELLALPSFARAVADAFERAAQRAREQARIFVIPRSRDRVRQRLIQLAGDYGRVTRAGIRLDIPLTHELLGAMVGAARESVTRAVDDLEREGFLVREGRNYQLLVSPDAFRDTSFASSHVPMPGDTTAAARPVVASGCAC
jgi:CRP-like cAMP-binding protein